MLGALKAVILCAATFAVLITMGGLARLQEDPLLALLDVAPIVSPSPLRSEPVPRVSADSGDQLDAAAGTQHRDWQFLLRVAHERRLLTFWRNELKGHIARSALAYVLHHQMSSPTSADERDAHICHRSPDTRLLDLSALLPLQGDADPESGTSHECGGA